MSSDKSMRVSFAFLGKDGDIKPEIHFDFPTTKDELQQMLEQNGIHGKSEVQMSAALYGLEDERYLGSLIDITFDEANTNELNFLAIKLSGLESNDLEKFEAIIESGRYLGSAGVGNGDLTDYINIADNLGCFTFHPNMDESDYGEHLLTGQNNLVDRLIRQLQNSSSDREQEFAQYVECLRECAETEQFGQSMACNNDGEFLNSGYLIEDGGFSADYEGVLDIPDAYRIWESPETFIKVVNVDLPPLLLEMHALGGNYTQDAAANLHTLLGGSDFFITENKGKLTVLPAAEVFRWDSPKNKDFMIEYESDARAFFASLNDSEGTEHWGGLHEIDIEIVKHEVYRLTYDAVNVDAEFKDGTNRLFTLDEWFELSKAEQEQAAGMVYRYDPADEQKVEQFLTGLRETGEKDGRAITPGDFLADLNAPFMERAQNQQIGMLRIAREAANIMVARSDADVYRLMPEGAVKLTPMDVVKSKGLWFPEHREFAIKPGGMSGLRKWADRTVDDIARQSLIKALNKTRDNEH